MTHMVTGWLLVGKGIKALR